MNATHQLDDAGQRLWLDNITRGLLGPGARPQRLLGEIARADIDLDELTAQLQREGTEALVRSWQLLLACSVEKSTLLETVE